MSSPSFSGVDSTNQTVYPFAILLVEQEPETRYLLQQSLKPLCAFLETAAQVHFAEELRKRYHFDLMVIELDELRPDLGIKWLQSLRQQGIATEVIFTTANSSLELALQALRLGAVDFLIRPFCTEQIVAAVKRSLQHQHIQRENYLLRRQAEDFYRLEGMLGQSEKIQHLCQVIRRIAPMPSTILIEGETGTGKELVARAIHQLSQKTGAFVAVNCGAISNELLESELFGHLRGAFTNAHQHREGLFSYAQQGTLFLDEIGEMPFAMQTKLLRTLEHKTIRPVGSDQEIAVNTRVIAATNRRLIESVKAGQFREDLFYRLNVLTLTVPPLRERLDDLPLLARHFSETLASQLGVTQLPLSYQDIAKLQQYHWPGNVRELKNIIERSLLLGKLPDDCFLESQSVTPSPNISTNKPILNEYQAGEMPLMNLEKNYITWMLARCQGNKSETSRRLGISRKTLDRKLLD
jgi:DNA-binding NtrC family response regulator